MHFLVHANRRHSSDTMTPNTERNARHQAGECAITAAGPMASRLTQHTRFCDAAAASAPLNDKYHITPAAMFCTSTTGDCRSRMTARMPPAFAIKILLSSVEVPYARSERDSANPNQGSFPNLHATYGTVDRKFPQSCGSILLHHHNRGPHRPEQDGNATGRCDADLILIYGATVPHGRRTRLTESLERGGVPLIAMSRSAAAAFCCTSATLDSTRRSTTGIPPARAMATRAASSARPDGHPQAQAHFAIH